LPDYTGGRAGVVAVAPGNQGGAVLFDDFIVANTTEISIETITPTPRLFAYVSGKVCMIEEGQDTNTIFLRQAEFDILGRPTGTRVIVTVLDTERSIENISISLDDTLVVCTVRLSSPLREALGVAEDTDIEPSENRPDRQFEIIPISSPLTPTATSTPTPIITSIPTASPNPYSKPQLIKQEVSEGCNVTFSWNWDGVLARDEYFAVRASIGEPGHSLVWTKDTQFKTSLEPPGDYVWEVAICRGDPGTGICEELSVSEQGSMFSVGTCLELPWNPLTPVPTAPSGYSPNMNCVISPCAPAPQLVEPQDGALLRAGSRVELKWEWTYCLPDDWMFNIRFSDSIPPESVLYLSDPTWIMCEGGKSVGLFPMEIPRTSGTYYWEIAVTRSVDGTWERLSETSETRYVTVIP
jgi:hypothetical protein